MYRVALTVYGPGTETGAESFCNGDVSVETVEQLKELMTKKAPAEVGDSIARTDGADPRVVDRVVTSVTDTRIHYVAIYGDGFIAPNAIDSGLWSNNGPASAETLRAALKHLAT